MNPLFKSKTNQTQDISTLYSIGVKYAVPYWKWYFWGILALIVTNLIMLQIPQLTKLIVNAISDGGEILAYSNTALSIMLLGLVLIVIRTISRVCIFWPGRALEANIKDDLFCHILEIPMNRFESFGLGDLTSRLSNDVTQLRVFFAFGALQVLNVIFMSSFTIVKMTSIDSTLTTLTVLPLVLMLVLTRLVMPKLYRATRDATEATGRLTNRVTEAFHHVAVIQSSAAMDAFVHRSQTESKTIFDANMRTVKIRNLIFPLMSVMAGLSQFSILLWGGFQVISNRLSVGDLLAFSIYVGMLVFPFTSIGLILSIYQRAKPSAERLAAIASLPKDSFVEHSNEIVASSTPSNDAAALLEVKNLTFAFPGGAKVLTDINFVVKRGSRVGIYGSIGSGKSTLFNLITKLHPPPKNTIFLNGVDTSTLDPEHLRSEIAYAQQTPLLFSDTIRENLILGFDPGEISESDLHEAAKCAQILDEINGFKDGWDTVIGESGVRLSGGQRQRLALARILLRKSKIIILDDVLSAVDMETERQLIAGILSKKSTLIIASHRASILEPCDEVLIFEKGTIIARGPYSAVKDKIANLAATEAVAAREIP
jgi:ATP-binding cassette subfamily B protein